MVTGTELALRLARADADLWRAWVEALAELPANPYGAEARHFGDCLAMLVHAVPLAHYNRVVPSGSLDAANMEEVAGYYRARQTPCRVDINPDLATTGQTRDLERTGFQPAEFQSNLCCRPQAIGRASPSQITVDEVTPRELHFFSGFFNRAYYQGEKVPRRLMRFRADTIVARYGRPGWRFYLCRVCDIPAAGGVLFVRDGVGTLAGAATMESFRRRGCQRALMQRRAADAAAMGCDLLASRCGVGSVSQRNLERAGMGTAYTKVIWGQRGLFEERMEIDDRGAQDSDLFGVPQTPERELVPSIAG